MSVYFAERDGLIKIGWSENVPSRMMSLKSKLLGAVPGDESTEAEIHKRFSRLRVRGEWFRPEEELLTYIQNEAQEHKPEHKNIQTAVRLPESSLKLADAIAKRMSKSGFVVTRSEVLRAAVATGLKAIEMEKR